MACTESSLSRRPRNFLGLFVHKPPWKNFFLHIFVSVINKSVEENFCFVIVFFYKSSVQIVNSELKYPLFLLLKKCAIYLGEVALFCLHTRSDKYWYLMNYFSKSIIYNIYFILHLVYYLV